MIRASDYGRALFELARQEHREGEIGEEMAGVRAILEQQPAYARLLDSPALPGAGRLPWEEAFSSLNLYHLNFLKILCEKHAVKQYAACARVYGQLYDQAHGILRATAMTAVAMSKGQAGCPGEEAGGHDRENGEAHQCGGRPRFGRRDLTLCRGAAGREPAGPAGSAAPEPGRRDCVK